MLRVFCKVPQILIRMVINFSRPHYTEMPAKGRIWGR